MNLACRGCRRSIGAAESCALCEDFKRHLISVDEDEVERPSLSDVGSESVSALRRVLKDARAGYQDEKATADDRECHADRVVKVSNTLSKILEAARKLQTDGLAAIRNMSFLERAELFIGWYAALPPAQRTRLRDQMTKFESETSRALPEVTQ